MSGGWDGDRFSLSRVLGGVGGGLRPFHSVVGCFCPVVCRSGGSGACAQTFRWCSMVVVVVFLVVLPVVYFQSDWVSASDRPVLVFRYSLQYKQIVMFLIRLVVDSCGGGMCADLWCLCIRVYIVCRPRGSVVVGFGVVAPRWMGLVGQGCRLGCRCCVCVWSFGWKMEVAAPLHGMVCFVYRD